MACETTLALGVADSLGVETRQESRVMDAPVSSPANGRMMVVLGSDIEIREYSWSKRGGIHLVSDTRTLRHLWDIHMNLSKSLRSGLDQ